MKKYLMIALLSLFCIGAKAQDYNWAIGVRGGGNDAGVTLKHILSDYNALELDYNYQYGRDRMIRASVLTLLYEWNRPVITDGFLFYFGLGAHIGAATMAKEHNDANFLAFGGRIDYQDDVLDMINAFITTAVSPEERHARRREKMMALEG
jgi:hypothetical protein